MASFFAPLLSVAMLSPISHELLLPLGFWGNIAQDLVYYFFGGLTLALISIVTNIFTGLIQIFLFPPAPRQIGGLEELFMQSTFAFFAIISVSGLGFFAYMMIFPHNEQADPFRFVNRLFAAFVLLAAGKYILNAAFLAVNQLGLFIYPSTFQIAGMAGTMLDLVTNSVGSILTILVALVILHLTAVFTILSFFAILAIRALLIYAVYALFPVFIGLWVVDVGPFQYGNMIAELAFKAFALLLSFGLLIAAILATGGAIAGYQGEEETADVPQTVDGIVDWEEGGSASSDCGDPDCKRSSIILKLMAYFGSLWASLAIGASSLGMLISMKGSGAKTASRGGSSGSSGGQSGGGMEMQSDGMDTENAEAGPQSFRGKVSQKWRDVEDADNMADKAKIGGAHLARGGWGAAKGLDNVAGKIAESGNNSMMETAKSGYGKAKDRYQNDSPADSATEDVQQNADSLEGNQVDMNGVHYDGDSEQLTDKNGENGIDYEPGEDGPELQDGQRYNMSNVDIEKDDDGNAVAHGNEDTEANERIPTGDGDQTSDEQEDSDRSKTQ